MWQKLFGTDPVIPLAVTRIALGVVMFPHGAQKLLGWWGGSGFGPTMAAFSAQFGAPLAFLAICAEFFGGLGLILGFLSRIAAFGIFCDMAVAVATLHYRNGLFMNWTGRQNGEGFEFHILAMAIAVAVIIGGGGALSIDGYLSARRPDAAGRAG
jgi:putative oxidoreductase